MPISTPPLFPVIGAAGFNASAYAYSIHMSGTWRTEANALEANVNAKEASTVAAAAAAAVSAASAGAASNGTSTSTSSVLISEAPGKVFTVAAGKSWVPGMVLHAYYNDSNSMLCTVASYVGTTLTLDCLSAIGSGTYAAWSIFPQTAFRRLPIFSAQTQTRYAVSNFEDITPATYSTGLTGAVYMVVFGNSLFLAASATSQASIASSANGTVWTLRTMPSAAVWRVGTDGANKFVASTAGGVTTTAKSTDGITWVAGTATPAAISGAVGTPAFAGGVCCVFGNASANFVSSDNAATWSASQTLPAQPNTAPISIGGLFWFWNTGTTAYTSATGLTGSWTLRTLPVTPVNSTISMQTNGKLAICVATSGAPVYETSDGINWTLASVTVAPNANVPFLLNGVYVSYSTSFGQAATYANGAWTPRVSTLGLLSSVTNSIAAIAGSVFVSGVNSSTGLVVTLDTTAIPKTAIFSS